MSIPYLPYKINEYDIIKNTNHITLLPRKTTNEHQNRFKLLSNNLKLELKQKYPNNFIKVSIYNEDCWILYPLQQEAHKRLKGTGLSPEIIDEGIAYKFKVYVDIGLNENWVDKYYILYLVMEKLGQSLDKIYIPVEERDEYIGPGFEIHSDIINDFKFKLYEEREFQLMFPEKYFTKNLVDDIKNIIIKLSKLGIILLDVHTGNFLKYNETILAIDFECVKII